jgi:hypothetical protein
MGPAVAVVLVVGLAVASITGCTSARDTLGTNSSPCFRALAIARSAVHDRGTYAGVRIETEASLSKLERVRAELAGRSTTPLHNLCVVSYRGTFRPEQVQRPAGRLPASGTGHFAIVVISTPQNDLLATFVLEHEPVRFRHVALGAVPRGDPGPGASGAV